MDQTFLQFYMYRRAETRRMIAYMTGGIYAAGPAAHPLTIGPQLHAINYRFTSQFTWTKWEAHAFENISLSCLISRTHLFLINCLNNYTKGVMCQFAVTHEVPSPSELAKICKKCTFPLRSLSYYYYYPTVQPSLDHSHFLIVLLLWSTSDGN